jgi:hypothetical protein
MIDLKSYFNALYYVTNISFVILLYIINDLVHIILK